MTSVAAPGRIAVAPLVFPAGAAGARCVAGRLGAGRVDQTSAEVLPTGGAHRAGLAVHARRGVLQGRGTLRRTHVAKGGGRCALGGLDRLDVRLAGLRIFLELDLDVEQEADRLFLDRRPSWPGTCRSPRAGTRPAGRAVPSPAGRCPPAGSPSRRGARATCGRAPRARPGARARAARGSPSGVDAQRLLAAVVGLVRVLDQVLDEILGGQRLSLLVVRARARRPDRAGAARSTADRGPTPPGSPPRWRQ